jgi:hypothetical protein
MTAQPFKLQTPSAAARRVLATIEDPPVWLGGRLDTLLTFAKNRARLHRLRKRGKVRDAAKRALTTQQRLQRLLRECEAWEFADEPSEARTQIDRFNVWLVQLLERSILDPDWGSNEQLAGEFWPAEYAQFSGRRATMTRGGDTVRFVEAAMHEIGIEYSEESIIAAMRQAKKPIRRRSGRKRQK